MNKDLLNIFINEINQRVKTILNALENNNIDTVKLEIHALKGTSNMMGFTKIGDFIHEIENKLKENGLNNMNKHLIRDFLEVLPQSVLHNDDKILKNIIENHEYNKKKYQIKNTIIPIDINSMYNAINTLTQTYDTTDLKKIREIISNSLREFYNLLTVKIDYILKNIIKEVKNIAQKYNKKVNIEYENDNVKIDKQLAEDIITIIITIIRNAISHGIEIPEERIKKGKNETGSVKIKIDKTEDNISIEIYDDGNGIYNKKLNKLSKEKNIPVEELIFLDGVTSKEKVDSISGRGEGLASIRTLIKSKNGDIRVESEKDKYTKFTINLPYNMITNYYYIFKIEEEYIAFKHNFVYSISKYHKDIQFNNIFNLDSGILINFFDGYTILVSDYVNKVERYMYKLPNSFSNTPYSGWFTYMGKPCLVMDINKIKKVGKHENIKVS